MNFENVEKICFLIGELSLNFIQLTPCCIYFDWCFWCCPSKIQISSGHCCWFFSEQLCREFWQQMTISVALNSEFQGIVKNQSRRCQRWREVKVVKSSLFGLFLMPNHVWSTLTWHSTLLPSSENTLLEKQLQVFRLFQWKKINDTSLFKSLQATLNDSWNLLNCSHFNRHTTFSNVFHC